MRLVIDTNLWVSYLFWPDSRLFAVLDDVISRGEVLRSAETFSELSEVIMRRKFDAYLPIASREAFLEQHLYNTHHITITERINACRDPKDNKFLELAVSGKADFLLTGDQDLLCLDPFRGIRILAPSALLQ